MIRYYTGSLINEIFANNLTSKKYEDEFGRLIGRLVTEWNNLPNNLFFEPMPEKSYIDLMVTKINSDPTALGLEIKYRMHHYKDYVKEGEPNTHIINADKYNSIINNYNVKTIRGCFLISIWSLDGEIWATNVIEPKEPMTTGSAFLNATTNGDRDGQKIYKDCCYFKPSTIIYYCFRHDDELNTWTPMFNKERPFDVDKLNKEGQHSSVEIF